MNPYDDPLQPHSHDPNPEPPSPFPDFRLQLPDGTEKLVTLDNLYRLPAKTLNDCYIVSTGHGTTGPFAFSGPTLLTVVQSFFRQVDWHTIEVISGDGFGTRIQADELWGNAAAEPMILAYAIDGKQMSRHEGLVRLIVPSETDDALRQVKWVERIRIVPKQQPLGWYNRTLDLLRRWSFILLVVAITISLLSLLGLWWFSGG